MCRGAGAHLLEVNADSALFRKPGPFHTCVGVSNTYMGVSDTYGGVPDTYEGVSSTYEGVSKSGYGSRNLGLGHVLEVKADGGVTSLEKVPIEAFPCGPSAGVCRRKSRVCVRERFCV